MKFSTVEEKRKVFIDAMIDAENIQQQIAAYKKAYPKCKTDKSARVRCYKMLQTVEILDAIKKGKQEKEETIKAARKQKLIETAREAIAHELELDAILSAIALGKYTRKRKIPVFNRESKVFEIVSIEENPTETDIIAAADKLYKRKGSYPRVLKIEHGGLGGKPIQYENVATVLVLPSNGREMNATNK